VQQPVERNAITGTVGMSGGKESEDGRTSFVCKEMVYAAVTEKSNTTRFLLPPFPFPFWFWYRRRNFCFNKKAVTYRIAAIEPFEVQWI
jgi:hypothetical protein